MPRGDNTQPGKQGFQPSTRGKTAPKTPTTPRSGATTTTPQDSPLYDEAYAIYLGQTGLHDSAITPDGGMVMQGPNGWNTFDQDDNYLGTYATEKEAYDAIQAAHNPATPILVTRCDECGSTDDLRPTASSGWLCTECRVALTIDYPDTPEEEPALHQDVTSRTHPVYGGTGWGVSGPDIDGDYTINHGHYGASEIRDGKRYVAYSDVPLADHEVCWSAHNSDRADAKYVWENRDAITAELHRQGLGPLDVNATRLKATVSPMGDRIRVEPFSRHDNFTPFDVRIALNPYE